MKKILFTSFLVLSLMSIGAPAVLAQAPKLDYSGFVKCDGVVAGKKSDGTPIKGSTPKAGEEERQTVCNFAALIETVIKTINWMFIISIPVATALFAYAGALYMTAVPGKMGQAKKIFVSVGIGFIIMISAWVAVRTLVGWFAKETSGANTFLPK